MDCELKFKHSIQHYTMTEPHDVKTLNDEVYILSSEDNPYLHVFHKSGNSVPLLLVGRGVTIS